jgi:hypothetical protein
MGLEKKATIQALLSGKFNQAAGLYYSLAYQKMNGVKPDEIPISAQKSDQEEEEEEGKKPGDISDELAQVLFQVERTREPNIRILKDRTGALKKKDKPNTSDGKLKKKETQMGLPKLANNQKSVPVALSNVVPLPEIPQQKTDNKHTAPLNLKEEKDPKFGIPQRNHNQKPIPIDETLYQREEEFTGSDGPIPRTIKFAFNCVCHSKMTPEHMFERLSTILDKNDVVWYNLDYLCACEWGDIKFEVEVCKLPRLQSYGVRIKRNLGDNWEFKKLSSKITMELDAIVVE